MVQAGPSGRGRDWQLGLAVCSFRFLNSQESCMILGRCEAECEC